MHQLRWHTKRSFACSLPRTTGAILDPGPWKQTTDFTPQARCCTSFHLFWALQWRGLIPGLYAKRTVLSGICQGFTALLLLWIGLAIILPKSIFTVVYEVLLIIEMLSFGIFYICLAAIAYFAGRAAGRDYL